MIRRPPRSTHFPSTRLFRSSARSPRNLARSARWLPIVVGRDVEVGELLGEAGVAPAAADLVERRDVLAEDRKSTRLNSSHANISYAVFCLQTKRTPPRCYIQ